MTGPAIPQDDPMLRLRYYRETGQASEAQNYERYLRETGQWKEAAPTHDSGFILRRNARGMANDREAAALPEPGYVSRFVTHALNAAQGIPGVRPIEAAAGALGSKLTDHPMTFAESRGILDAQTGNIGGKTSAFEHLLGSVATLPFLPANPTVAGALLGGANEALSADDESLTERGLKTAVGAGVGAMTGKLLDHAVTAARTAFKPTSAAASNALAKARDDAASASYGAFRKLGDLGRTPDLDAILNLPVVRTAATTVKNESPNLAKLPDTDAAVLDAIYKRIGSKSFRAINGAETTEARTALLDAIEGAANAKGTSYAKIVGAFKDASREIGAVNRGSDMVKGAGTGLKSSKSFQSSTPEAFASWAENASPAEKAGAVKGILGGLKDSEKVRFMSILGTPLVPRATPQLKSAASLLRVVDPNPSRAANVGLLGINSLVNTP